MPPEIEKNLTLTLAWLKTLYPAAMPAPAPPKIGNQPVPYYEGSSLIYLPQGLIFLIASGPGRHNSKIQTFIQSASMPAAAILPNNDGSDLTLIGKNTLTTHAALETLNVGRINQLLSEKISTVKPIEENFSVIPNLKLSSIEPQLQELSAPKEILALLERYTSSLTHNLIHNQNRSLTGSDSSLWREVALAALEVLPSAIKDAQLSKNAITIIAKSVVFLPLSDRLKAVLRLLEIAVDGRITSDIREQLSSIALVIAPSLNSEELSTVFKMIRLKLSPNERVPPSLAQIISLVQSRNQKT